MQLKVVSFVF